MFNYQDFRCNLSKENKRGIVPAFYSNYEYLKVGIQLLLSHFSWKTQKIMYLGPSVIYLL